MSKRRGESLRTGKPKVKKRNGVKIRSLLIPDSDEENPVSNVDTSYTRLVKTRVTTSGQVGRVTSRSFPFLEVKSTVNDPPEDYANHTEDTILQIAVPKTSETRKKRKKENDSVAPLIYLRPHPIDHHHLDENALVA